jgi:phosphotransacetylase
LRLQDEFSQLIPNTQNASDLAHEITSRINDTIFRLSQLEEAKVDSEQRLISVRQDYDTAQANFLLAQEERLIITSDIQTTEQELLKIEEDLVVAQNSLLVAETREISARSALLLAVTKETAATKELENIRLALVIF